MGILLRFHNMRCQKGPPQSIVATRQQLLLKGEIQSCCTLSTINNRRTFNRQPGEEKENASSRSVVFPYSCRLSHHILSHDAQDHFPTRALTRWEKPFLVSPITHQAETVPPISVYLMAILNNHRQHQHGGRATLTSGKAAATLHIEKGI